MQKKWQILIGVLCLVTLCACGNQQEIYQEKYDLGVKYLSEGNYEKAVIAFTAAIEIDAKRVEAYMGRGDAYAGTAEAMLDRVEDENNLPQEVIEAWEKTVADYLAAIELDDTLVDAYAKAAQIYSRLGNYEAAIALLEKGIERTSDEGLQALLEELRNKRLLKVVVSQTTYLPDGTLCTDIHYYFDEAGYPTRREHKNLTGYDNEVPRYATDIDTWIYEGEPGHCWYIPDHEDKETGDVKREEWLSPGNAGVTISIGNICCYPYVPAEVRETGGGYYNEYYKEKYKYEWHHAIYTFDDKGDPVAGQTHEHQLRTISRYFLA